MSRLLKCSMKQEIATWGIPGIPPYSPTLHAQALPSAYSVLPFLGKLLLTLQHPAQMSHSLREFHVFQWYLMYIFYHSSYILLSLFIGLSPQKGRSFVVFTFPPPTLTTMPVTKFFHSKWLRADCQRCSVEATNVSFNSTLLLINCRTLDKAVNSKRQLLHA